MRCWTWLSITAIAGGLAAGCDRSSAAPPAPTPAPAESPALSAPAAGLDPRTPVPLTPMMAEHQKQQMRDHLRVVQEIAGALAVEDYGAIAASAARISSSDAQTTMCAHMGAGAPGFAELGLEFHRTADGIIAAAAQRDHAAVAGALDATLQKCVGCHDTYRQDIVDEVP